MNRVPAAPTKRTQTVLAYQGLVRSVAIRIARGLPGNVDVQDLISEGLMGLLDALERFDPARGVPFAAYAELRVRGAIMDHVRSATWVPRPVIRRARVLSEARESLELKLGRAPTREEMAAHLEVPLGEYDALCGGAHLGRLVSGDQPLEEYGSETIMSMLPSRATLPDDKWIRGELRAEVRVAIGRLPEREAAVITQYYLQGLPLKQIALGLELSEGRVSQIGKRALERLRSLVQGGPATPEEAAEAEANRRIPKTVAERQALLLAWRDPLVKAAGELLDAREGGPAEGLLGVLVNRANVALLDAFEAWDGPISDGFPEVACAAVRAAMATHLAGMDTRARPHGKPPVKSSP